MLKATKTALNILLTLALLIPLMTGVALADTEKLTWDSISYVYFEQDASGNIQLGQGATFSTGKDVVYYSAEHNPKWADKKIKSIKNIKVGSISNINQLASTRQGFYRAYEPSRGSLSNANIVGQEIIGGNSLKVKTNLAINPPLLPNGQVDASRLANITTIDLFNKFKNYGGSIPDSIADKRAELEATGKKLLVMPVFLLYTVELETEAKTSVTPNPDIDPANPTNPSGGSIDLSAKVFAASRQEIGTYGMCIGWLVNNSNSEVTTKAVWRVNGKTVKTLENVKIPAKDKVIATYDMHIPSSAKDGSNHQIEIEINPNRNQPTNEPNWANNKAKETVKGYKGSSPSGGKLGETIIVD